MHPAVLVYHLGIVALCVARRRSPIGGWLLFYATELLFYVGARLASAAFALAEDRAGLAPGHWSGAGEWLAFLVVSLPLPALAVAELVAAAGAMLRPAWRTPARLRLLRIVLGLELAAAVAVILLDAAFWPQSVERDVNLVLWPAIWGGYFASSRRVARVFGAAGREAGFPPGSGP